MGSLDHLARAMRELRERSAGVVWLNPHAGAAGFTPSARGMREALPYLTALLPARDERDFAQLSRAVTSRVVGGSGTAGEPARAEMRIASREDNHERVISNEILAGVIESVSRSWQR